MRFLFLVLMLILLFGCLNQGSTNNDNLEVNLMGKKALFIIAHEGFRDEELFETKGVLEKYGIQTTIASTEKGTCSGMMGGSAEATISLDEVDVSEYDAIIFIGGAGTPSVRETEEALAIAKEAYEENEENEVVAAICWAPTILAKAGILEGKNATVWVGNDSEYGISTVKVLEKYGAIYVNKPVVVDGKIITAIGPSAAKEFGEEIAKALK